jgi:uncharacterized membrane protein
MTWRGSATPLDRIFASLPYLLPLLDAVVMYSGPFQQQFPTVANVLFLPLAPFLAIYLLFLQVFSFGGLGLGGLIIFFALYFLVVRNEKISHFIRFNTMQSIIVGIVLSIFSIVWSFALEPVFRTGLIQETLFNVALFGTIAVVAYSIVQSVMGRYADIPTLSDAAYMQVR